MNEGAKKEIQELQETLEGELETVWEEFNDNPCESLDKLRLDKILNSVLQLSQKLWVIEGILCYNLNVQILLDIVKKYDRLQTVPNHYNFPELIKPKVFKVQKVKIRTLKNSKLAK